jgi:hypothetical protein
MIPNHFHFVWFGREFPFTHALALRSVAATCAPAAIFLHHADDLTGQPHYDAAVRDLPCLAPRRLDLEEMLAGFDATLDVPALRQVYRGLEAARRWAALSDVIRYLVLLRAGGVYLDLDVLVVRDLAPLRAASAGFCGRERLLVPASVYRRKHAWTRFPRTAPLDLARTVCSKAEGGVGWWKRIEGLYPAAVNCAVLGLTAGHALALEALREVPRLAPQLERRRPVIGPDLLQDLVDAKPRTDVVVLGPAAFYPLGPTMAFQYFKRRRNLASVAPAVLTDETYVLHWYNDNLRLLPKPPDAESVAALAQVQLFAHFAAPFLPAAAPPRGQVTGPSS